MKKEKALKLLVKANNDFAVYQENFQNTEKNFFIKKNEPFFIIKRKGLWFQIEVEKNHNGWIPLKELLIQLPSLRKWVEKNTKYFYGINLFKKISNSITDKDDKHLFDELLSIYYELNELTIEADGFLKNPYNNRSFPEKIELLIDGIPHNEQQEEGHQIVSLISNKPSMNNLRGFSGANGLIPCLFQLPMFERLPDALQKYIDIHRGDPALPSFRNPAYLAGLKAINNLFYKVEPLQQALLYFKTHGENVPANRYEQIGKQIARRYDGIRNKNNFSIFPLPLNEIPEHIEPISSGAQIGLGRNGPFLSLCNFEKFKKTVDDLRCYCAQTYLITSINNITSLGTPFCPGHIMEIIGNGFGNFQRLDYEGETESPFFEHSIFESHVILPGNDGPIRVSVLPEDWSDERIMIREVPDHANSGMVLIHNFCQIATHDTVIDTSECGIVWKRGENRLGITTIHNTDADFTFSASNVNGESVEVSAGETKTIDAESCTPVTLDFFVIGSGNTITISSTAGAEPLIRTSSTSIANSYSFTPDVSNRTIFYTVEIINACSGSVKRGSLIITRTAYLRVLPLNSIINAGESNSLQLTISCPLDADAVIDVRISGGFQPDPFDSNESSGLFFASFVEDNPDSFILKSVTLRAGQTSISLPNVLRSHRLRCGSSLISAQINSSRRHTSLTAIVEIRPIEITIPVKITCDVALSPPVFGKERVSTNDPFNGSLTFPIDRSKILFQLDNPITLLDLGLTSVDLNITAPAIPLLMTRIDRVVAIDSPVSGIIDAPAPIFDDSTFENLVLSTRSADPMGRNISVSIEGLGPEIIFTEIALGGITVFNGGEASAEGTQAKVVLTLKAEGTFPHVPFTV